MVRDMREARVPHHTLSKASITGVSKQVYRSRSHSVIQSCGRRFKVVWAGPWKRPAWEVVVMSTWTIRAQPAAIIRIGITGAAMWAC